MEFVYDDITIVKENPRIRSFGKIPQIFGEKYWPAEIEAGLYRPLTLTTFAIDYQIWGLRPWGYRLVNLLIHLGNTLLVLVLLGRIGFARPAAFLGALLFGIHPIHAEVVTSVVGRTDLMATFFVCTALLLFIRHRESGGTPSLVGLGICFLAGLLSKEAAICLPLLFVAWDFFGRRSEPATPVTKPWLTPYLVLAAVLAVYLPVRFGIIGAMGPRDGNTVFHGDPVLARWGTMLGVLFDYLKMFLFPVNLAADFPYHPGQVPGFDLRALLGAGVLVTLLVGAFRLPGRFGFAIAIFLLALAPVSNVVITTGIVKAVRLLYLPSIGLSALGGWALWRASLRGDAARALLALGIILLMALNVRTTTTWLDNETLWRRTLRISPDSAKGLYNLGALLTRRGEMGEAERLWLRARRIDPRDSGLPVALGRLYLQQERLGEAEESFTTALSLGPPRRRAIDAMLGLAEVFAATGEPERAERQIRELLKGYPDSPGAHFALGMHHATGGRWREAEAPFRQAVGLDGALVKPRIQLGLCLYRQDRPQDALREYHAALNLVEGPEQSEILVKMGDCQMRLGETDEAADLYGAATLRDPENGPGWNNLGLAYLTLGEDEEAREAYLRAKTLLPDWMAIPLRLGEIALRLGEKGEARRFFEEVLASPRPEDSPLREEARRLLDSLK